MLVAVTAERRRMVASATSRSQEPVCPHCGQQLVVRLPRERVAHFAHRPHANCSGPPRVRGRRQGEAGDETPPVRRRRHDDPIEGQGVLFDA